MRNFKFALFLVCGTIFFSSLSGFLVYAQDSKNRIPVLSIFQSPYCRLCMEVKDRVVPKIEKEFRGKIRIDYRNIEDPKNYQYFLSLKEKFKPDVQLEIPLFFLNGKFFSDRKDVLQGLRNFILDALDLEVNTTGLPQTDLVGFFKRFNFLGVTLAGLEDGINPCAFTVIVFFISFLALQGYRKRELIIIGTTFIAAVFLTYLAVGLGIFNFLYALKGFWLVTRVINICVGVLSIILGILAFYDFFKFKRDSDTEGQILQLPQGIKKRIHSIIGRHYRKAPPEAGKHRFSRLVLSAISTGFLVTLLEAVCTGQVYLPTIIFILKTTNLKFQAFLYLIYYNLLFVVPLLAIFIFALSGVTSQQFSVFLKKHLAMIKLAMAVLFFALGIFLLIKV